jgi:hypothetical protein
LCAVEVEVEVAAAAAAAAAAPQHFFVPILGCARAAAAAAVIFRAFGSL